MDRAEQRVVLALELLDPPLQLRGDAFALFLFELLHLGHAR